MPRGRIYSLPAMLARILPLAVILLTIALPAIAADDAQLGPRQGVLLLHNGALVQGEIVAAGDRYDVRLSNGELHVKKSDVKLACASISECYDRQRLMLEADNVADHLELAEWCLRNGLLDQAEQQITEADAADSSHPKTGVLKRRLQVAKQQPRQSAPAVAAKPDGPSGEDLDRMVRSMPRDSVETFTATVQPLLVNHCSTAACHGATTTSDFRLYRTSPGRVATRRTTQRNLYAVLGQIDAAEPDESPLLVKPLAAHGTSRAPIFNHRDAATYRLLMQWVYRVAHQPETGNADKSAAAQPVRDLFDSASKTPAAPAAAEAVPVRGEIDEAAAELENEPLDAPATEASDKKLPTSAIKPQAGKARMRQSFAEVAMRRGRQSEVKADANGKDAHGVASAADAEGPDPFDPESFNRQFHEIEAAARR